MFTGIPPFYSNDQTTMMYNIENSYPEFPRFIPSNAVDLLSKLLEKDPIKRTAFTSNQGIKRHAWFADIGMFDFIF